MKKYIALFLVLALALSAGLALAETDITGLWYADLGGAAAELSLDAGGSYRLSVPTEEEKTGVWKLDDGFVYMDGSNTPDLATWGENALMLGDGLMLFTREKPWTYAPAELIADAPAALFAGYWVCQYVDTDGSAVPADLADDATDLYVDGHSAILGGPAFGDTQVKMELADGAMRCESNGAKVSLQIQQDGFLRLTAEFPDAARTWYMARSYAPALDGEE